MSGNKIALASAQDGATEPRERVDRCGLSSMTDEFGTRDDGDGILIHAKRSLIVDRDPETRQLLARNLSRQGFDVFQASSAQEAYAIVHRHRPDIAIIDCTFRGESGLDLVRTFKDDPRTSSVPVIVLTVQLDEEDTIRSFEAGADDYVTKPFSVNELMARVRALMRRVYRNEPSGLMRACGLVMNVVSQRVTVHDRELDLTPLGFRLLSLLMTHPGKALTRSQILSRVWEDHDRPDIRAVDAQVSSLRQLLKDYQCDRCIQTVYGIGYRFSAQDAHSRSSVDHASSDDHVLTNDVR